MKRLAILIIAVALLSGCTALDKTVDLSGSLVSGTESVISKVLSGGKIHITLGIETDAAHNNDEVVE